MATHRQPEDCGCLPRMRRGRSWSCSPVWWHHNVWLARYLRPPVLVRMDERGNSPLLRGAGSRPARMDNLVWALGSWFGEPRHLGEGRRRASGYQGAHARSARSPHPSYRDTSSRSSSVAPLAPVTPSAWHSSPPNSGSRAVLTPTAPEPGRSAGTLLVKSLVDILVVAVRPLFHVKHGLLAVHGSLCAVRDPIIAV